METETMLAALGVPTRYRIFTALLERKHCVRSLSRELGISESAVSQHLKVMREAGLVEGTKYGYHTHYLPRQEALDVLAEAFASMREQALSADRDVSRCRCAYREETEK